MLIEVTVPPTPPASHTGHIVLFTNNMTGFAVSFEVGTAEGGPEGWVGVLSQTLGRINKPGNIKRPFPLHL